jgi:hypothetical protein
MQRRPALPAAYPHHMLRKCAVAVPLLLRPMHASSYALQKHGVRQGPQRGWAALSLSTVCGASGERTVVVVESPAKVRVHMSPVPSSYASSLGGARGGPHAGGAGVPACSGTTPAAANAGLQIQAITHTQLPAAPLVSPAFTVPSARVLRGAATLVVVAPHERACYAQGSNCQCSPPLSFGTCHSPRPPSPSHNSGCFAPGVVGVQAKTIENYLGEGYTVLASFGHVRDLVAKVRLALSPSARDEPWRSRP